jgi:SAM-dependent methyltransferase
MSGGACPQCGEHEGHRTLFLGINADHPKASRLPIIECGSCAQVFTDLSGVELSIDGLYAQGYYGENTKSSLINRLAIWFFQRERLSLALRGFTPKKVLDVGCGDGAFLSFLPSGITRCGFEVSQGGQAALKSLGFRFVDIAAPDAGDKGTFDLLTMWQSLEHVDRPVSLMSDLKALLSPDGTLFVSIPNFASIQARLFKSRWFHLDPARHVCHYSPSTLQSLCDRAQLRLVRFETFSWEYGVFGWWQSIFNCLPLEFNMGYKVLKGRARYAPSLKNLTAGVVYACLAVPVGVASCVLAALEAALGRGAVLQAHLAIVPLDGNVCEVGPV